MKLCECGCGQQTRIVQKNHTRSGARKGDDCRFLRGHNSRHRPVKKYATFGTGEAREMVHRLRAERALGKPLPRGVIVHHVDGTKSATSPLVICQDHAYHMLLHRRMRIKARGGDPNTEWFCRVCRSLKPFAAFRVYNRRTGWLRTECNACAKLLPAQKLPNQPQPGAV